MTIVAAQNEIVAEFEGMADWFDVYEALVKMGRELGSLEEDERNDENSIPGCQSNVWLKMRMENGIIKLEADSDALITKGILSLLLRVLDGRPPGEILNTQLFFLYDIGLSTNLSPSRSDGLNNIIGTVMDFARNNGTQTS